MVQGKLHHYWSRRLRRHCRHHNRCLLGPARASASSPAGDTPGRAPNQTAVPSPRRTGGLPGGPPEHR